MKDNDALITAAAQIAAAKIAGNPALDIAEVLREAVASLKAIQKEAADTAISQKQIADSIKPDILVCLEDGTEHVMLRRYIKRKYNMTPEQYKQKWGLPDDYPMVARSYARLRSKVARNSGLGKFPRNAKIA